MFIFLEAVGPIYATSLSPPLFIEVSVPSQECEQGTPVSSTNKTDRHDIAEILLKVAFNTIN
jgi:hypothetical protein